MNYEYSNEMEDFDRSQTDEQWLNKSKKPFLVYCRTNKGLVYVEV